jgi:hypothetical protein
MRTFLLIGLIALLFPVSGSADYYRYVDDNGIPRYVDTLSKVPDAYKNQVARHTVPTSAAQDENTQKSPGDLFKKRMEQDEEYTALMKEKEAILESIRHWEEKYKAWENKKSALDKKQ